MHVTKTATKLSINIAQYHTIAVSGGVRWLNSLTINFSCCKETTYNATIIPFEIVTKTQNTRMFHYENLAVSQSQRITILSIITARATEATPHMTQQAVLFILQFIICILDSYLSLTSSTRAKISIRDNVSLGSAICSASSVRILEVFQP